MGGLLGILCFISIFFYPLFVLRPIIDKAKTSANRIKARFTILDLFSLVFLIQIPAVLLGLADFRKNEIVGPAILGMFAAFLVWLAGIRALNHIGIENYKKRLAAVGAVFPFAIAGDSFFSGY